MSSQVFFFFFNLSGFSSWIYGNKHSHMFSALLYVNRRIIEFSCIFHQQFGRFTLWKITEAAKSLVGTNLFLLYLFCLSACHRKGLKPSCREYILQFWLLMNSKALIDMFMSVNWKKKKLTNEVSVSLYDACMISYWIYKSNRPEI